jgi:chemotaxis methyl-accepting protein methylase
MTWSFKKSAALPEQQFFQWEKLLEERTGIQLAPQQKVLLQTQVSIRMRELDIREYDEYFNLVANGSNGLIEWQILVDRLVVKETSFFRHRPSLEFVRQFLQNRIDRKAVNDSFEMWSVGCATGEEPYSLAMVANDCFELAGRQPYFGVTATDISLPALNTARNGIYISHRVSSFVKGKCERYLQPLDEYHVQIKENIKKRGCFTQGNIIELKTAKIHKMEVIFCQNVLVYFRRWLRKDILNHLVRRLKPGGVLIIGLGETTDWQSSQVQRVANDEIQAYVKCVSD